MTETVKREETPREQGARPGLFVGAVLIEIAVVLALWAFGKYFGP